MAPKELFDGHERRRFVRLKEPVPVKFKVLNKDNPESISDWIECYTHNISRGGLCIEITSVGEELKKAVTNKSSLFKLEITLSLRLEEKKVIVEGSVYYIKVLGEPVWNHFKKETLEVGIKFTGINSEDEDLISNFIVEKYLEKYGIQLP